MSALGHSEGGFAPLPNLPPEIDCAGEARARTASIHERFSESALAGALIALLREQPRHFGELVEAHMDTPWREFLHAWGEVRESNLLERDEAGRYAIRGENSSPCAP